MSLVRPSHLAANVWTGNASPRGDIETATWGQRPGAVVSPFLAPTPVDKRDWRHPEIGWGVVLADDDTLNEADRAMAADAPRPIRDLLAARGAAPVFRYRADLENGYLRRYYGDRDFQDMSMHATRPGTAEGHMPLYLLIVGSPEQIPWSVQFTLNMSRYVGRLDLDGPGLRNYVDSLLRDWGGSQPDAGAPVLWNVDHGGSDITGLMAFAVGDKLWERLSNDPDTPRTRRLRDQEATGANLVETLAAAHPAFVATTSHGLTGPLEHPDQLKAKLGSPVDANYVPIEPASVTAAWEPHGAIWYSHACCSAGSDAVSRYADLFAEDDPLALLLAGVCNGAGACTAPLPRLLLGAARPLRAFVGHVEPTFDWTLRDPSNQQIMSHQIVSALYSELFRRDAATPIGYALGGLFIEAGAFFAGWAQALSDVNDNVADAREMALYAKLVAMDRQGTVLLGDPTVSLAP